MIRAMGAGASLPALLGRALQKAPKSTLSTPAKDERTREAEEALNRLKQSNDDRKRSRKAAARQKVDRLKKQIEALRMFSGGNPKAIAREAARLARELSAAVKEYGGAAGGSVLDAPAVGPSTTGTTGAAASEAVAGEADADGQANADAQAGQTAAAAPEHAVDDDAETRAPAPAAAPPDPAQAREAAREDLQKALAETDRANGEKAEDAKFRQDVRNILNQLKAIIAEQRRRAARQEGADQEFDQFARDVAEAAQAIAELDAGVAAPDVAMAGVDIRV